MISKLFGVVAVFLLLASVNGKFPDIYFNNFNLFCLNTFYLKKLLSEETLSEWSWSQKSVIFNDIKKTLKLKEIWWLLLKFIWIFIWIFFFFQIYSGFLKKHLDCFMQCQHFFKTRCYFLWISSVGILNIPLTILVVIESRGLEKNYIHFSNNTFPLSTVITNLGSYIWGIWFIQKNI